MPPRAVGRMRERVLIYKPVRTSDGALGFNREEGVIANDVWARIKPSTSSEVFAYQHLEQRITHSVLIRYNDLVRQGQHVRWGQIELYIEAVVHDERKEFSTLQCRQGGNL